MGCSWRGGDGSTMDDGLFIIVCVVCMLYTKVCVCV